MTRTISSRAGAKKIERKGQLCDKLTRHLPELNYWSLSWRGWTTQSTYALRKHRYCNAIHANFSESTTPCNCHSSHCHNNRKLGNKAALPPKESCHRCLPWQLCHASIHSLDCWVECVILCHPDWHLYVTIQQTFANCHLLPQERNHWRQDHHYFGCSH